MSKRHYVLMRDNWRMTDSTLKVTKHKYFCLPSYKKNSNIVMIFYVKFVHRSVLELWTLVQNLHDNWPLMLEGHAILQFHYAAGLFLSATYNRIKVVL